MASYVVALDPQRANKILNAASGTGAGATFAVPQRPNDTPKSFTWSIVTDASNQYQIDLEGSLDNSNWIALDSFLSSGAGGNTTRSVVNVNPIFIRANVKNAGNGTTFTVYLNM